MKPNAVFRIRVAGVVDQGALGGERKPKIYPILIRVTCVVDNGVVATIPQNDPVIVRVAYVVE